MMYTTERFMGKFHQQDLGFSDRAGVADINDSILIVLGGVIKSPYKRGSVKGPREYKKK